MLMQFVVFASSALILGYLSDWPSYRMYPPGHTELKLVVRHSGKLLEACRERSAEELSALPRNMRRATVCPREKSPMMVELSIDGEVRHHSTIHASGIHDDGVLALYKKFPLPPGTVDVRLRIKDDTRLEEFSHDFEAQFEVSSASTLVIQLNDAGINAYQPGLTSH